MERDAVLDASGRYRYSLTRRWADGPVALLIGVNPSTADASVDDPTIRKEIGFARRWDCGTLLKANLFAYRATDPADLIAASRRGVDVVGPENDDTLLALADRADMIVVAWGANGSLAGRDTLVLHMLDGRNLYCLGYTKCGRPRHPLMLSYSVECHPFKDCR